MQLEVRFAVEDDREYLLKWLLDPTVLEYFPMIDKREVLEAIRVWMSYIKKGAVLTVLCDKTPCGIANLYIQSCQKLAHQCLFAIIVDKDYRGKGVGSFLLKEVIRVAREKFHIELLHLEVYENNPALFWYKRLGFREYGYHKNFIKHEGKYYHKVMMQKSLI